MLPAHDLSFPTMPSVYIMSPKQCPRCLWSSKFSQLLTQEDDDCQFEYTPATRFNPGEDYEGIRCSLSSGFHESQGVLGRPGALVVLLPPNPGQSAETSLLPQHVAWSLKPQHHVIQSQHASSEIYIQITVIPVFSATYSVTRSSTFIPSIHTKSTAIEPPFPTVRTCLTTEPRILSVTPLCSNNTHHHHLRTP
ncbi:hypothetical protein GRF29_28g2010356 [Pseudopithomyces chartarum]|uniref:Uncharacterized protein n=1 Tax=Pseudopithomyces chartarum TaxID=1892770 RepID=A0AAN6M4D4_9PLEO|nr:hypothetical protein GRF29_28g2010356 [Pseudopithomyces chartarum]